MSSSQHRRCFVGTVTITSSGRPPLFTARCHGSGCPWHHGPRRSTAAEAVVDGRWHLREAVLWRPSAVPSVVLTGETLGGR